jgi:hypothetical protein
LVPSASIVNKSLFYYLVSMHSFLLTIISIISIAHAYPIRTHVPWAILLCKFSDSPAPQHDVAYMTDMFLNRGTGGVADYWNGVSYANIDFAGSVVKGWYTISQTQAQEVAKGRWDRLNDCVAAAKSGSNPYTVPSGYRTLVITSPGIDEWGGGNAAFLSETIDVTGSAHEMGHGMGMIHSFSDDPNFRDASWAQIGEYDDEWDLMSAANVYTTQTSRFGSFPPGLNGFGLDRAGWVPIPRVYTFGRDSAASATVTIAALDHPEVQGSLLVRVPFDPGDLMHYYTVELRTAKGTYGGTPDKGGVMLHEVKLNTNGNVYQSYLLRNHDGNRDPVTSLNRNGITITVNWVNSNTHQASVTITGDIAKRCLQGYVWREAFSGDDVCVTPDVRAQAQADNNAAASRRSPTGGPFGPDTCLQGYVWREASPTDHVCVPPQTRTQTQSDNANAASRRNPSQFVYGPTTCANGYVWREADNSDYVCVTPAVREQAKQDNAAAGSRRNPGGGPFGPGTCLNGYVWREAFLGDQVCVVPATRAQAGSDNAAASGRVAHA